MPTFKSTEEILSDLENFLSCVTEGTELSLNAILRDLSLRPTSVALELFNREMLKVANLQLLSRLEGEDLENEGLLNYGLVRKTGTKARGVVTFATPDEPRVDIVIPKGTGVATKRDVEVDFIRFYTTETKIMYFELRANYFDPTVGMWTIDVPVEAALEGEIGNVYPRAIKVLLSPIPGITTVFNKESTYGGLDSETDSSFRERIKKAILGRSLGQKTGLEQFVLSNSPFHDARVMYVEGLASSRVEGEDIYVIDFSSTEVYEKFIYASGVQDYILTRQPVLAVQEVVSQARGLLYEKSDYEFIRDQSVLGRSARARDKIRFFESASLPDRDVITVTYVYADEIGRIQERLNAPENFIIGVDPLVKRADAYYVDITLKVTFFSDVSFEREKGRIRGALADFLSRCVLGTPVQSSDIIVVAQTGYSTTVITSVDYLVLLSLSATSETGERLTLVDGVINIPQTGFARLGSVTFI